MSEEKALQETEQTWIVENAGMVLLWPYLSPLFERMELLKGDHFVNESKQEQAVLLLEYFIWGQAREEGDGLVLNKVFCGLPITADISAPPAINDNVKNLTDGLLQAVINYWPALGDTSIDTFRESFLQRPGTIGQASTGWDLKVEHRSYDVLLSQLPWSISLVNLPWLKQPIKVQWAE